MMVNAKRRADSPKQTQRLRLAQWRGSGEKSLFQKVGGGLTGHILVPMPRWITSRPVDLRLLARGPFEEAVAQLWSRRPPPELLQLEDPNARRFLFRCYLVPEFAASEIWAARYLDPQDKEKLPPWWMFEPATYVLAWERMSIEGFLRRARNGRVSSGSETWVVPRRPHRSVELPEPSLDWLLDDGLNLLQLEDRFDEWRQSAMKSFSHCMTVKCRDIGSFDGVRSEAALLGAIEHLTPLPKEIVGDVIAHLRERQHESARVFHRFAAQLSENRRLKHTIGLDTWLIEVHPLTQRYSWQHRSILDVARAKFNSQTGPLTSIDHLRGHMRRLKLELAPDAAKPGMRHGKDGVPKAGFLTPIGWLATFIAPIALQDRRWLLGQLGYVRT